MITAIFMLKNNVRFIDVGGTLSKPGYDNIKEIEIQCTRVETSNDEVKAYDYNNELVASYDKELIVGWNIKLGTEEPTLQPPIRI